MQINISIDEETYKRLQNLSKKNGSSINELARAMVCGAVPISEICIINFIEEIDANHGKIISKYECRCELSVLPIHHNMWGGILEIENTTEFLKDMDRYYNRLLKISITTENQRYGNIIVRSSSTGGTFENRKTILNFVGVTSL